MFEGWGAAAVGAATVAGSVITASAAKDGAKTQANAENQASELSQSQYEQTRADQTPYRDAGNKALSQLSTGIAPGGEFTKSFSGLGDLSADPGYQFRMDQGMRGVDAGAAARGGVLSGAALKAEQRFGQDYASGEYENAFNRYTSQQTNAFNRLASVAGIGQTSANQTAAAGQANVNAQTDALVGSANASAAGSVGSANAVTGGINSLANWYQQQQYLSKMNGAGATTPFTYSTGGVGTGGYSNSSGVTVGNNPSAYVGGG